MPDLFADQLSPYLDNELDELRRRRLEAHLADCAECAATLSRLRAIVAAAPHYPGRAPARDLWSGIESRLGEAEVVPIGSGARTSRRTGRFSWPELIAASLLMAALGGGAAWLALRPAGGGSRTAVQPLEVHTVAYAESQYQSAIADLTTVLEQGRGRLDPATVRIIDESLRKIDTAIAEARAAIQRDSSNVYLNRQIAANMRRKLNLLRAAATAIART